MLKGFKAVGSDRYSKHLMSNVLQCMVRKHSFSTCPCNAPNSLG